MGPRDDPPRREEDAPEEAVELALMDDSRCRFMSTCRLCLGVGVTYRHEEGHRLCTRCLGSKIEPAICVRCRGSGQRIERVRRYRFLRFEFGDLVPRVVNCDDCDGHGHH